MIRWRPAAMSDIAAIYGYVVKHDIDAARTLVRKIHAAPNRLIDFPKSGAERPEIADGLRGIRAGKYVLLYQIAGADVEIIRVLHSARDLAAAFAADL